ncbi:CLUMA_CG009336, isoform A [Clunio marinus]|uniref:CLUMA_CG009336, isoform A n=1 Tax=Clunio marinus TaxID=568069 RepID=A0A1J1I824_9DIPT|nr:CLUMA_CG009336, isoform A [Clunio marinus]
MTSNLVLFTHKSVTNPICLVIFEANMESKYEMTSFKEFKPKFKYSSASSMSDTLGDSSSFNSSSFNSSDGSFKSNIQNNKEKNFDLSMSCNDFRTDGSFNSEEQENCNKRKGIKNSFLSFIRTFKDIKKCRNSRNQKSILRQPTEYVYVKGFSGVPMRVIKDYSSPISSDYHLYVRKF